MDIVDAPASHGEVEAVGGELREIDACDIKQPAGLLANRIEDDGRLCALRNQRGQPAQRRLLVGESMQLFFAWVFAIAVARSSVNWLSRVSASPGSRTVGPPPAETTPHTRPSTTMGAPTPVRTPASLAASPIFPETSA